MRTEPLDAKQALAQGRAMPFVYVRTLSGVWLGPAAGAAPDAFRPETLLEARFFGDGTELRLFRNEGGLHAVRLILEDGDDCVSETIQPDHPRFGGAVTVCTVLDYDGDGQAYRKATLLTDWKEAAEK